MTSFEDLGLSAELVEALAAEGYERPTAFQAAAIPTLRRGNSLIGEASPGAGVLLAYGVPLVDRIAQGEDSCALVLVPTVADAEDSARALARLALAVDVRVAALDSMWAEPHEAQVLFATAQSLLDAVRGARLKLDRFTNLVVVDAGVLLDSGLAGEIVAVSGHTASGGPGAVLARPAGPSVDALAEQLLERPVHIPPRASVGGELRTVQPTGKAILYRVTGSNRREALLSRLTEIDEQGARRAAVLFRTEDDVADVGDFISLHGFSTGELGDEEASHWISTDSPDAVDALRESVEPLSVVCFEPPGDEGVLQTAAKDGHEWMVLARAAEVPHLKAIAQAAGVDLRAGGAGRSRALEQQMRVVEARLRDRLDRGNLTAYGRLLEDFVADHDPLEVAAAALALLGENKPEEATEVPAGPAVTRAPPTPAIESWAKLFISIGSQDGIRPGDLLGAVTGEAGIAGSQVGKIDVRDAHSQVEVDGRVANKVIRALNGTTIRGRALRVDLDRSHRRPDRKPSGADRKGGAPRRRPGPSREKPSP